MKISKKKRFIQFLKDEGVFEQYKNNWDVDWVSKPITSPGSYIDDAFHWRSTPEGSGFWAGIDDKWVTILDNLEGK